MVVSQEEHGFVVGHIVPEAQIGGAIALVENGDIIEINAEKNTLKYICLMLNWQNAKQNGKLLH